MEKAIARTCAIALFFMSFALISAEPARADYFNYPCQPPGTGTGVDVKIVVDVSGQFCDGPTQINLTHLHCESGGGGVTGGGIGLGSIPIIGGITGSVGGIFGGPVGGSGQGCSYRCPDGTIAPQPNPPWSGSTIPYLDVNRIIKAHRAFCVVGNHLIPQGGTSELVRPEEGDPDNFKPGEPNLVPGPMPPSPEGDGPAEPPPPPAPAPVAGSEHP